MASLPFVIAALNEFVDKQIKSLVLDVVANLVSAPQEGGTPVDTAWARANWVPKIGAPHRGTVGTSLAVSTGAQDSGVSSIAGASDLGSRVYITNNVPYIVRLNMGHSKQAPAGFVQRAVARAVGQTVGGLV